MFCFYVVLSLTLVFNGYQSLFVTVDDYYPNLLVNHPYCGRSVVPKGPEFLYRYIIEKCYPTPKPPTTSYYDENTDWMKQTVDRNATIPPPDYEVWTWKDSDTRHISRPQSRVTFGKYTEMTESPWAVFLTTNKIVNAFLFWKGDIVKLNYCSGTLITLEWVMTAAHCTIKDKFHFVYAGDVRPEQGIQRKSTKIFVHPKYGTSYDRGQDDIALIKLNEPYETTVVGGRYTINPVCLPRQQNEINRNIEWAYLYGYGRNLGKTAIKIARADIHLKIKCATSGILCTHYSGNESMHCPGDSGAGLIQRVHERQAAVLVGVTSKGPYSCAPPLIDWGGTFSYVAPKMEWILETIANN